MAKELLTRIQAAAVVLRPLAAKADVPQQHWIHGADEGLDWCADCAEKEIERLKAENPGNVYILDGGWEDHENDGTSICHGCHKLLCYSLTKHGAQQELVHFMENGIGTRGRTISPQTAYELIKMFEGVEQENLSVEDLQDAAKIADEAIVLLSAAPETPSSNGLGGIQSP